MSNINGESSSTPIPRVADKAAYSKLIYAVLSAAAEVERTNATDIEQLGPESMLMLSIGDGLTEALEWAHEGVASDEPACMWLGSLRWMITNSPLARLPHHRGLSQTTCSHAESIKAAIHRTSRAFDRLK